MKLYKFILDCDEPRTRDELRFFGKLLDNFDSSTVDRALRKLTEANKIEPIVGSGGFNEAYKIYSQKTLF